MTFYPDLQLYIDGRWESAEGEPVINPCNEKKLGTVPFATQKNLDDAVAAARKGFNVWRNTPPAKRSLVIRRAVEILRERSEEIAAAISLDLGKPIKESRGEVLRSCEILEWDANEGRRLYGRVIPGGPGMRHTVLRQPIGVVFAITPWNFPLGSPSRKVGGALASGCSIILKAAKDTPAGAFYLTQAFHEAGLPAGVLNLVYGQSSMISEHLIKQPDVRLITFTGSTPVGKHLSAMAGKYVKPAIMELGGHGPVVVCDDADPIRAAKASVASKMRNTGQVCVAPTRFFIQEGIFYAFAETFVQEANAISIGDSLDESIQMGPLVSRKQLDAMTAFVADARDKGGRVLAGGSRIGERGYFFPPTVLTSLSDDADIMQIEPFGPIALLIPVKTVDEAIRKANSLPYGLAAYAYTNSADRAARIGDGIEAGNISINHFVASLPETPFGGIKESGYGREGGTEGLESYTIVKNISHQTRI